VSTGEYTAEHTGAARMVLLATKLCVIAQPNRWRPSARPDLRERWHARVVAQEAQVRRYLPLIDSHHVSRLEFAA
jgi:hypothetical protein